MKRWHRWQLLGVFAILCVGCAQVAPLSPELNAAPSATRQPAATRQLAATPSMTCTPLPTGTATTTSTATPSPTPTRTPGPAPHVIASYPIDGDLAVRDGYPIVLEFDYPMEDASVAARLAISPTVAGTLDWQSPTQALFAPSAPRNAGTTYELTLEAGARTVAGGTLARPFELRFTTGGRGAPIPILMYHHIKKLDDDATEGQRTWTVSPQAFEEQMRYLLSHGWHSIGPDELVQYLTQGAPLPPRPVMITMDDGYKEVYATVLPLLRDTPLRPVLFIVPGYMGYGDYLNWEQLAELVQAGFLIGSHSYDHANLREQDDAGLEKQIGDSRYRLEDELGITVDAFCYPFGSYDERTLEALQAHGYRSGYTLNPTSFQSPDDPYRLGRRRVDYTMTLDDFCALLPTR